MGGSDSVLRYISNEDMLLHSDRYELLVGRNGKIILAGSAGCADLGCSPGDMAGMNWFEDWVPETVRSDVCEEFRKGLADPDSPSFRQNYPVLGADGSELPCQWSNTVLRDEDGIVMCILISGHGTSPVPRERETPAANSLSVLVEESIDPILVHRDGIILYANPSAKERTGWTDSELLGASIFNFVAPEYEAQVLKNMTDRISGGEPAAIYTLEVLSKDGAAIPVEISVSEVSYGGERSFMAILRDLSGRQTVEDRARHLQKMEAVSQLAGGMAHDFNNILQVISGYAEMAESTLEPDHPAMQMLQQISGAGERAGELVRQLMLFSRNQLIVKDVLDLNTIVSEHLPMLRKVMGEGIAIESLFFEEPVYVRADHSMIGQILLNISLNSRDAMPEGGEVIVRTGRVYLDSDACMTNPSAEPGFYAMLSISDTGHGMDEETLERVFEPFFSTKGISSGTGLGLSTVYGIVTQHDGIIRMSSEPGGGTAVEIFLPIDREGPEIEDIPKEYVVEEGVSRTVIIAEDDESVRNLATEVLTDAGLEVITADNGEEAVLLLSESPDSVDLILMDAVMPVLNGCAAADRIRELKPELPIIFCSGYARDKVRKEIARFGPNSRFLSKPYSMSQLMNAINELLSDRRRD